jgi:hypothetical protein
VQRTDKKADIADRETAAVLSDHNTAATAVQFTQIICCWLVTSILPFLDFPSNWQLVLHKILLALGL